MSRRYAGILLLGSAIVLAGGISVSEAEPPPKLLSWSEQMRVREGWLPKRCDMLLQMMRRNSIDMWIIVNEEFHDDPLTQYVAPPRPYTGGRDIFVFVDAGDAGLKRIAVTGFAEENLRRFFESPEDPRPAVQVLPELFKTYDPRKIALNIGGSRGVTRSLTHDSYLFLSQTLGPEATSRFVSAQALIEEYLDTRIPEEREYYTALVRLTENLARRSLSNEVVIPGKTTVGDVRRWLYDQLGEAGVRTWFQPDLRIYANGRQNKMSRGFPAVADESTVIERGNVVHLDFGLTAMGFDTDWQRDAYVLREGEVDAPEGLKRAMANTHLLQDALMLHAARPGLTAGEVTEKAQVEMEQKGIDASMYCHPEGNQGHGLGTGLGYGFRANSPRNPSAMTKRLRNGSYISIELNTQTAVPEWGGQKVLIAFEDPAYLTEEGFKFFVPRQEQFYLIK